MRRFSSLFMVLAMALIAWRCTSVQQNPVSHPSSWAESQFVQDHITAAMIASSPGALCPKYAGVDHLKFWDAFVRAVVSAESSMNPADIYVETTQSIDPVTGKPTLSEGYLQLSYKDTIHTLYRTVASVEAISYPLKNIQDPHINLAAGLGIMDIRIQKYGPDVITALAPYWSTIRLHTLKLDANLKLWIPECFE